MGEDARQAERGLAWTRLVAAAYGAWQLVTDTQGLATWALGSLWALMAVYVGASVAVLLAADDERLAATMRVTFVLDAVVVTGAGLLAAIVPTDLTFFAAVAVPVLGGLKFGLRGAATGFGVLVLEEVARTAIRSGSTNPVDAGQVALVLILGFTIGGATGWLSELQARATESARRRAEDLRRTTEGHEAILRVLRAGINTGERTVARHVVDELRGSLGPDALIGAVISRMDSGALEAVVPAELAEEGTHVEATAMIDPDGPLQLSMMTGEPQQPSEDVVRGLSLLRRDTRSLLIQPMKAQGRILGCLVAEAPRPDAFGEQDVVHLGHLADAAAVVLSAALAYEQETQVAERHRQLDRMKTDFVAITSHELRTPITAILGFAQTMERTDVELGRERRLKMVGSINRQARRLADLVDDLGTVSALDAGTLTISPGRAPLDEVVSEALEAFDGTDVRVEGPSGIKLWCDRSRLGQIVVNLLRNGLEHGSAPLTITWEEGDDDLLHLRVQDQGAGVPADKRESVFDRFVQLDPAEGHQRGSGLGLFISRALARAMDGDLHLVDAPGGATFEVTVPLDDPDD